MESHYDYGLNGKRFAVFVSGSGVIDFDCRKSFFQNGDCFSFSKSRFVFCKAMCTITGKQKYDRFLVLKRIIQHARADFEFFAVVQKGKFAGRKVNTLFVSACWTKHISNNILDWLLRSFKNINPLTKLQEKRNSLFFEKTIAHLTRWRALKILTVDSAERWKNHFVHAKYIRTHWNQTNDVPNKFNAAIVIPTIRRKRTTHRNCS